MRKSSTPLWKQKRPRATRRAKLSPAAKAAAKARAEAAGRRYPNLVDNLWAAQWQKRLAMK